LIAASDAIVAKAGYGTICEAMARGTPMIYPPRTGFAEYRSLDRALRAWGGGVPIGSRDFGALKLEQALNRALSIEPGPPPFPADGARRVAEHLTRMCQPARGRQTQTVAF
jgi:UDP-N-acetylglucosamine:LPS N-acetylglucosamine transferase